MSTKSKRMAGGVTVRLLKFASPASLREYLRSQGIKLNKKKK